MARKLTNPWWEKWIPRCPECDSASLESYNNYKFVFNKRKKSVKEYKCKSCNNIFWF